MTEQVRTLIRRATERFGRGELVLARTLCERILWRDPANVDALNLLAGVCVQQGEIHGAIELLARAVKAAPHFFAGYFNLGQQLVTVGRAAEAVACFDNALKIKRNHVDSLNNRGVALQMLGRFDEALASYDRALAVKPEYAGVLFNRATLLLSSDPAGALESIEKTLSVDPAHERARGILATAALYLCDWQRTKDISAELKQAGGAEKWQIPPFGMLGYSDDPALLLRCAKLFCERKVPRNLPPLWGGTPYRHKKVRIAYLSADFHNHATTVLSVGLFVAHDRERFEILGVSFGVIDKSALGARVVESFDEFLDVGSLTDKEIAEFLRRREVDIAVDLKGHTHGSRTGIFAHRPAPVQVQYLGYPGSMGADFIDFVIADEIVAPGDQQAFFSEKIVHLPCCYQVNDSKREIPHVIPSRSEAGLPDKGFIFCCFNINWKITEQVFDVWMQLLKAVPDSCLWLFDKENGAARRLRVEAAARGVSAERLVFAKWLPSDRHLARLGLADLFLDTLPCNAHTTASDALWVGVPVITCLGKSFQGRVAASLLNAVGLGELVTSSNDDYAALALKLAERPDMLCSVRQTLAEGRDHLFDTANFCRKIEAAYIEMWKMADRGERPQKNYAPSRIGPSANGLRSGPLGVIDPKWVPTSE